MQNSALLPEDRTENSHFKMNSVLLFFSRTAAMRVIRSPPSQELLCIFCLLESLISKCQLGTRKQGPSL